MFRCIRGDIEPTRGHFRIHVAPISPLVQWTTKVSRIYIYNRMVYAPRKIPELNGLAPLSLLYYLPSLILDYGVNSEVKIMAIGPYTTTSNSYGP
jgi:hypothetical protein